MRNLLVTGGAGFIGSNFAHHWVKHHPQDSMIVLDKLTYAGNLDNLSSLKFHPLFHFYHGDINDAELVNKIFEQHHINYIVNFAAESHVDNSIKNSHIFMETNVMGTHNLLSIARHYWLEKWKVPHRFHQISTDEVFGTLKPDDAPFEETHPYETNSPYSASKAGADHIVRAYHVTHGLDITISHCSNNYGPYHHPEKLIPLSLIRILQGKNIPIYGDGLQVRDWLHVSDHCRGIEQILLHGKTGESYNIGGCGGETANLYLIHQLCDIVDTALKQNPQLANEFPNAATVKGKSSRDLIQHVTDRPGHDRRYAINSQKIQRELDFLYLTPLEVGLKDTVDWYLKNQKWWKRIRT